MSVESYQKLYLKDKDAKPKERKHIILMDGTWNDETGVHGDGLVTNIVNMNRVFINDQQKQIVRYHRGVGNDNDNNWVKNKWKGATGHAISKIVEKAYARFVQDWQAGDHIYIFGFSRGSAAARLLASKINEEGIPKSIEITLEPQQNKETKVVEQVIADVKIDTSDSPHAVDIEFLGVWDTVSALGLKNNALRFIGAKEDDLFTNDTIAANIKQAVHLVAIDETRNPFVPSLMNHQEGITHEVWFPGVHSDIGGSYAEDGIAQVSLHYMIQRMELWNKEQGLADFVIDVEKRNKYAKAQVEKAHFHFHGKAFGKDLRSIHVQANGKKAEGMKPKIHQLYHDICSKRNSYSVFQIKSLFKKSTSRSINFQYMPFNIKVLELENGYDKVS